MDFNEVRRKRLSNTRSNPDFGAIFMSNRSTQKECLSKKLFGLPLAFADFVKSVKAGMILFLFEYEKRRLYGVFEAISDGGMDIVPDAYSSSGKYFPAQVQIRVIWDCYSVSESDFFGAIKENYYAEKKFKFGLSEEQVSRLLWLFDSKKVRVQESLASKVNERHSRSSEKVNSILVSDKRELTEKELKVENPSGNLSLPRSQSISLNKEPEHVVISPCGALLGLEDYIPLCSPARSDPVLEEVSGPVDIFSKVKGLYSGTSSRGASLGFEDYIPLCSPECSDPVLEEAPGPVDVFSKVKSLYSDTSSRKSVFSRLNSVSKATDENIVNSYILKTQKRVSHMDLVSKNSFEKKGEKSDFPKATGSMVSHLNLVVKDIVEESEKNAKLKESVPEIMEKLRHSHNIWKKSVKKTGSSMPENVGQPERRKASVFSRLRFVKAIESLKKVRTNEVNKEKREGKKRKRRERVITENHEEDQNMTINLPMIEEDHVDMQDRQIKLLDLKHKEFLTKLYGTEGSVCLSEDRHKKQRLKSIICKENLGSCEESFQSGRVADIVSSQKESNGVKTDGIPDEDLELGDNRVTVTVTNRGESASHCTDSLRKKIILDVRMAECGEVYLSNDKGEDRGEQNMQQQVQVCQAVCRAVCEHADTGC